LGLGQYNIQTQDSVTNFMLPLFWTYMNPRFLALISSLKIQIFRFILNIRMSFKSFWCLSLYEFVCT